MMKEVGRQVVVDMYAFYKEKVLEFELLILLLLFARAALLLIQTARHVFGQTLLLEV